MSHLVFGPDLRPYPAPARRMETLGTAATRATASGAPAGPAAPAETTRAETTASPGARETAETVEKVEKEATPASRTPARTPSRLPLYHPTRLRRAVRRRMTQARRVGTRVGQKASGAVLAELYRRELVSPAQRRTAANGAIALRFGASALASRDARRLFATADVVVPMDARSQAAAWLLAQRIQGPDVVVGMTAAARVITERRGA